MISMARERLQAFRVYEVKTEEGLDFKSCWRKHFKKITKVLPNTLSQGSSNSKPTELF